MLDKPSSVRMRRASNISDQQHQLRAVETVKTLSNRSASTERPMNGTEARTSYCKTLLLSRLPISVSIFQVPGSTIDKSEKYMLRACSYMTSVHVYIP